MYLNNITDMYLGDVTEEQMTEFFINDPKLCYMGLCDDDLNELYLNKRYAPHHTSYYQGIYEDDKLVAVIKFEKFSPITVNVHLYIQSSLHGKGKTIEITDLVCDYLRDTSGIQKVLIMAPRPCVHSCKAAEARGFKLEGTLTNGCIWRKEIVDILIYALDTKRK